MLVMTITDMYYWYAQVEKWEICVPAEAEAITVISDCEGWEAGRMSLPVSNTWASFLLRSDASDTVMTVWRLLLAVGEMYKWKESEKEENVEGCADTPMAVWLLFE